MGLTFFCKDRFPESTTGLVIAGFGEQEMFPSLYAFNVEGKICGRLKYRLETARHIGFDDEGGTTATVIPFAQSEMVHTFLRGIDPYLDGFSNRYLNEIFDKYPEIIVQTLFENMAIPDEEKERIKNKLQAVSSEIYDEYRRLVSSYTYDNYISPIMDIVHFLPKDELASMAETLVNLTSFKRKITTDAETVGGPIDVAVISKGDGFIWIKRKHYFKPELNHHFFK